jgi:NAD(P)-dependent dehydrogenase (short-subunit alcohol dehydrogenase family)
MIFSCTVDISDEESVKALSQNVKKAFDGKLDIVVNNAAVMEPLKPFLDTDPAVYWKTWEVNVCGLFNMARAFMPLLLSTRADGGIATMINLSSSGALSARSGSSSYRTSKLAILGWTSSLQVEYADQALLTYCVNPGAIQTQISERVMPEEMGQKFPHKADVAGDSICWLSSERRGWLGGRYVSCHWDMEELEGRKQEVEEGDLLKMGLVV